MTSIFHAILNASCFTSEVTLTQKDCQCFRVDLSTLGLGAETLALSGLPG